MTLDEKLDNFYQSAIDDATSKSVEILDQYDKTLQDFYNERKDAANTKAASILKIETDNLLREKNKNLSNESLSIKRKLSEKSQELIDSLFVDILEKVKAFLQTSAYKDILVKQINETIEFANGNDITIYINASDVDKKEELEKIIGRQVEVSDTDFIGGTRCIVPSKHILIDNSFLTRMKEEKTNFKL
jgi:vacuolar-type H+-ATPase subunit E/Vma4